IPVRPAGEGDVHPEGRGAGDGVRDPDAGLWYQVLDKGDDPGNWIETSCSSLFLYAMAKGRIMGLIDASIDKLIAETYRALTTKTRRSTDGGFLVDDICIGTGIGDYRFYLDRPRSTNDLHGVGAYILAALEVHRVFHLGQVT
ncbi:MAG: glycoside hydrolase family 88 protein, partial [Spirochaetaceae bacterium]|nr:glycoside hydrolase family 88 protein [Spirochaetaceae bacterium]